jgi:hypothetical protein
MLNWLKHAFSVEVSNLILPSPAQAKAIDAVCREIVRRQMTLPAQMFFESSAPLHFLGGQMLRFFEPVLAAVLDSVEIHDFASFLEQRGALEYICQRLEDLQVNGETK